MSELMHYVNNGGATHAVANGLAFQGSDDESKVTCPVCLDHLRRQVSPLAKIVQAEADYLQAHAGLRSAVHEARVAGESWHSIGAALGVTRQAAWERFKKRDEEQPDA